MSSIHPNRIRAFNIDTLGMIQSDHSNRPESPVDGDAAVLCVARGVVHRVRAARAHAERRDEAHLVEVEVAALLVEAQLGADQHAHVGRR